MSEPPPAPAGILAYRPEPGQVGQARAREYGVGEEGLTDPLPASPEVLTCAYAKPGGHGTRPMLSRRPVQALDQGVVSLVRKHPLKPAPG